MALGADGKLPMLVLHDSEKPADEKEKANSSSPPWLLLLVFGFSITASVAMLFVDSGSAPLEKRSQSAAREALRQYYTGDQPPLAPFQLKVRLILQASQRGDREEERRLCRDVLDLLHAESKSKFTGVTGMIDAPEPPGGRPSDRHLESLISTILQD